MKRLFHFFVWVFPGMVWGQDYTIDWCKVAGGGGTSTAGGYSVAGTIGQPDAAPTMTGGPFTLQGGFWGMIGTVPTSGAPWLSILFTTTNTVMVYWPYPSTRFSLQVNNDLATANWVAPAGTVLDDGTIKHLILNPPPGPTFYRLRYQ